MALPDVHEIVNERWPKGFSPATRPGHTSGRYGPAMGQEGERRAETDGERPVSAEGDTAMAAVAGDGGAVVQAGTIGTLNVHLPSIPGPIPGPGPGSGSEPPALSPADLAEALRHYATRVRECYGGLDLEVLIPLEEGEHPAVALNEVFVPPSVRADPPPVELPRDIRQLLVDSGDWPSSLPPGLEREALERARQAYAERPARDVLELLADPAADRIVLLGDPGAGKSTLARHLALALTTEGLAPGDPLGGLAGRVPFVVELREYAAGSWRDQTFEDFFAYLAMKGMAPSARVTEHLLAQGRAVVVFDGLDELFDPAAREQVAHRIADFTARHVGVGVRVVVTSRVIGYRRGVLERAAFEHHMIQDLTKEQIAQFARQWYATAYPHDEERARRLCTRVTDAVAHSRPVAELAGNPLLLTILAIIGRRRDLPRDRQGVYRHAIAVLVAHWDEHAKHLRAADDVEALSYLGDEDRHELLRLVARRMQDGAGGIAGNHIHQGELLATFREYLCEQYELPVAQAVSAARTMVRQFRERNFILAHYGGGVYGFVHRAFLEYLAAEDIDRRYTRYREWTQEELIEEIFAGHAEDPAWHEVLLLLAGQLGEREAGAAIDRLLEMHRRRVPDTWGAPLLLLSVRALAEVRRIGVLASQSRAVVDGIIAFLEGAYVGSEFIVSSDGLPTALAAFPPHWSGRSRILRWYHLRVQFNAFAVEPGPVASILYQGSEVPQAMAAHARSIPARAEMLRVLVMRWGSVENIRTLVRSRASADPSDAVRNVALHFLSEGRGRGKPKAIRDRSVADSLSGKRALAPSGKDGDGSPAWTPLTVELALSAEDEGKRAGAASALSECFDDAETRTLLCRLAVEDPSGLVRSVALQELLLLCGDDEHVQALLCSEVLGDPEERARRVALELIVQAGGWEFVGRLKNGEADTWEMARRIAVDDPHEGIRSMACNVLWRMAAHRAGTEEILRDRAVVDSSRDVRHTALRGLISARGDEADTWQLVRKRVVEDPDEVVRGSALAQLCRHRSHETDVWELAFNHLAQEPSDVGRAEVLRLLRYYSGEEATVWALLHESASADRAASVRMAALTLLATGNSENPVTRNVIRNRATSDPDHRVRVEALRWWAVHEPDETGAELLRDRAVADPDPQPRIAALQSLAFGWPAHLPTLPLLRERADTDEDEDVRNEAVRALAAAEALAPLADQLP